MLGKLILLNHIHSFSGNSGIASRNIILSIEQKKLVACQQRGRVYHMSYQILLERYTNVAVFSALGKWG